MPAAHAVQPLSITRPLTHQGPLTPLPIPSSLPLIGAVNSLELQGQVHWYTSMLGKKATLKAIRKHLHTLKVPVIRSTQFFQVRLPGAAHLHLLHPLIITSIIITVIYSSLPRP